MEFQPPTINLLVILPFFIVTGWGVLLMVVDLIIPEGQRSWWPWFTAVGLILALAQSVGMWGYEGGTFIVDGGHPMVVADNFSTFLNVMFTLTGLLTLLLGVNYLRSTKLERVEFYMLLLFSLGGMMLMGIANDLIMIFLALELLSIPLYIMSALAWPRPESEESAMKYFLLGAFSSGIFVYGIALIYGATGATALPEILATVNPSDPLALAGIALLLVGFSFKVAAAPFHMWTPDVYEGAPTAVTAFMSVGAKLGGFAAMLRVFVMAFPNFGDAWIGAVAVLSALTLIMGNVIAIQQDNIKRMLAYSSIAHAGYILIAVAASASTPDGVSSALFYMMAYLFTNLGAFAIVIAREHKYGEGVKLDDYKGLAKRSPLMALAMAYFMLSLTGIPPTGGFSGKFFVFRAALEADLLWLAVIGVITSVVSGYYYLRIVYLMYMFDGEGQLKAQRPLQTAVAIGVIATVILGFLPGPWFQITRDAALNGIQLLAGG